LLVAKVAAGWPLPLISPFALVNFPYIKQNFPGLLGTHLIKYIFIMFVIFLMLAFSYLNLRRKTRENHPVIISMLVFFVTSLAVYFGGYAVKGGSYQVWKVAAFLIMPLGFVFSSMLICNIYYFKKNNNLINKINFVIGLSCLFSLFIQPINFHLISLRSEINQLKLVKNLLNNQLNVENIVLGTNPYQATMLAFNVLSSRNLKLFPLNTTYVGQADAGTINQLDLDKTRILVHSICLSTNHAGYELLRLDDFFFNEHLFSCDVGIVSLEGFSGLEPWGVWTDSTKASVKIVLPARFIDKVRTVEFDVRPYVVNEESQIISVKLNGHCLGTWNLNKQTILKFNIPASLTKHSELKFDFDIPHARRPSDINASLDTRLLGVGFISYKIQ